MEQHGDLSKPSSNARGRMTCIKNWEELAQLLNSDGSGDTKSTEKWEKGYYIQGNPIVNIEQGILNPQPHHLVECFQSCNPGP
ncbi:unnamed protein product [Parnassius apollo]|uniref:(apollo) hypothetical protein n=1 Tax=Parnassius apollo TaxID=110799 RepID=A0A8S3WXJ4_PARAO|nr:unnamed protein product [Parnassius apollo]